jgi:release factor glutamine methyltransferase
VRPAEVMRRGADYLARHGVENPQANAEQLLQAVLGVDRASLLSRDEGLSTAEAKAYGRALCRRCTGTPLQHLTREQGFRRLVVEVRPGVFIPRPETEILVDLALDAIAGVEAPLVIDACTGTGAVALAIKDERPDARVWATDLSQEAVLLARANATRLGLAVDVLQGDLLEPVRDHLGGDVALVTCNPPYVPPERASSLPADVLADPPLALFGGPEVYERLFTQARAALRPGGVVAVEIDEARADEVVGFARAAGFREVRVHADLAGRDRVVMGWKT